MATGSKTSTYTAAGNVHAPGKVLCLQWVKECWEALPAEIVQKSFCVCEISVHTDGMEDKEIHCLKKGGVATDAREAIRRETATLDTVTLKESDPFTDVEEDEDELDENKLVLEDC